MPTPGKMAAGQQSTIPRELLEQMPQQRGAIMGAGHAMTQSEGVMWDERNEDDQTIIAIAEAVL